MLWAKDAMVPMPPASMSKLMTIELLFRELKDGRVKLTTTFPVSEEAWKTAAWIHPSAIIWTVDDPAHHRGKKSTMPAWWLPKVGRDDWRISRDDERGAPLGLTQSHFVNWNGLPDSRAMSALDLANLARHLINDYPEYYHYFSVKSYTTTDQGKQITQPNRDLTLANVEGADGLKKAHRRGRLWHHRRRSAATSA